MCLSIPVKISEVKNNKAIVNSGSKKQELDISLTPEIKKGDYCLVNNGFIVKKISAPEAEEILKILKEGQDGIH